jgi:hypothetical protein
VFEVARVSYLLANSKCVVTEESAEDKAYDHLLGGMAVSSYGGLVEACVGLARSGERRRELEREGHRLFAQHREEDILGRALAA